MKLKQKFKKKKGENSVMAFKTGPNTGGGGGFTEEGKAKTLRAFVSFSQHLQTSFG